MQQEAIARIRQMEFYFDMLQRAWDADPDAFRADASVKAELQQLTRYYEDGQWLRDYELDENGQLPQDLKRGVLAQDALYDFLDRIAPEEK